LKSLYRNITVTDGFVGFI